MISYTNLGAAASVLAVSFGLASVTYAQGSASVADQVTIVPASADIRFTRHVVGADGATAGAPGERLVYRNTLGTFGAALGAGRLVADDISINAPDGCKLRRLEFPVLGTVDPNGTGGPYSLIFALYSNCPNSVPSASRPALIIPNSAVRLDFPDDEPRLISFVPPEGADVVLLTNVWLGFTFSRGNAGVMVGAPAMVGFSADAHDFPGFSCYANFGGFPDYLHASFNAQIYADAECPEAFAGYKNSRPSGPLYNPGANVTFADDIQLGVGGCEMVGYQVAVKGGGTYRFDMRTSCEGPAIPSTERVFTSAPATQPTVARFTFDPPISIPHNLWFGASVDTATGGVILAGTQPSLGQSLDTVGVLGNNGCTSINFPYPPYQGIWAALDLTITCAGPPPVGTCCDMLFTQCVGGPDDGRLCCPEGSFLPPFCPYPYGDLGNAFPSCAAPGTCESVCREMPQMNCPWPPRPTNTWSSFFNLSPDWVAGATCDANPFPRPCGIAACCRPDEVCQSLTKNQCDAVPPLGAHRVWQRGRYCEQPDQVCPINACFARTGDCTVAHDDGACMDPACCDSVCRLDMYCCLVEWDRSCVQRAGELCHVAEHDECSAGTASGAALLVNADSSTFFTNSSATAADSDPGFCCHPSGSGTKGFGTMWFKFVATDTSARLSTCNSDPHGDSLVNVFAVDPSAAPDSECANLVPLACVDDSDGCGAGTHGELCVDHLTPGATYYVVVASKTQGHRGAHQLEIRSPCFEQPIWISDDCNGNGIADGCELGGRTAADCNANGLLDECEIAAGTSFDCDRNGFLDECAGVVDALTPTILTQGAGFGSSVAMDGDWLVVGSGIETTESVDRHTLHFFKKNAAGWDLRSTFELPVPPSYVAVKVDTVLVTSDRDNTVYIFTCYGEGCYPNGSFQGPQSAPCPRFGMPLAYNGYKAVVGTGICWDGPGSQAAEVHVVRVQSYGWREDARISSPTPGVDTSFGAAVAIDNKTILVGAPAYHTGGPGAAYLYYEGALGWELATTLVPSDSRDHDLFGRAVSLDGQVAIVGATLADGPTQAHTGAVYVFRSGGPGWVQQAKLTVAPVTEYDLFGASVSLAGNILVVGALSRDSAHVYRQIAGRWIEESQLTVNPPGDADFFGSSVFTDGLLIAVGAPAMPNHYPIPEGRAFVFQPVLRDCNNNRVPDACDLRNGTSRDINYDGTPDECQQTPTPDADSDLDVDLKDFAAFTRCYTGPRRTFPQSECLMFDLPPDLDVDLSDFAGFQNAFRSSGR